MFYVYVMLRMEIPINVRFCLFVCLFVEFVNADCSLGFNILSCIIVLLWNNI